MNRLHKKCFIASTGSHLLLGAILVFGQGFQSSTQSVINASPFEFVPLNLITEAEARGGTPNLTPVPRLQPAPAAPPVRPAQAPVEPKPEPVREPVRQPEPIKPQLKDIQAARSDPDALESHPKNRTRKPVVNLTPVHRDTEAKKQPRRPAEPDLAAQEAKQFADARRRLSDQVRRAADKIGAVAATSTSIEEGPGGGGPSFASYDAWVHSVYETAWQAPEDVATEHGIAKVSVTIARDGTVLSASFSRRSGDASMDASVQRALDRVPSVGRPFPEGDKAKQRVYNITFDLKAKLGQA